MRRAIDYFATRVLVRKRLLAITSGIIGRNLNLSLSKVKLFLLRICLMCKKISRIYESPTRLHDVVL